MKTSYLILLIGGLMLVGCTIVKVSPAGDLYRVFYTENSATKDSETLVTHCKECQEVSRLQPRLATFEQGCYVMRLKNDTIRISLDNTQDGDKVKRKDSILVKGYRVENKLADSLTDQLMYLVFLDDKRVLYHSPYRSVYFKNGLTDSAKIASVLQDDRFLKSPKTYVFDKNNVRYFKLGFDYEFNSVKRGYYKICKQGNNFELRVWLETYIEKAKIVLTEMRFSTATNNGIITAINFKESWFRNQEVNTRTFDLNRTSAQLKLLNLPFHLLVINNQKPYIIDSLAQRDGLRYYFPIKSKGIRPPALEPEQIDSPYTF